MRLLLLVMMVALVPLAYAQEGPLSIIHIEHARADVQEMQDAGVSTAFVLDALKDADTALSAGDYQLVLEKTGVITKRKKRALAALDSIRALELRIADVRELGDVREAEEKLREAKDFFENENLGDAEEAVFEGERELRRIEGEYSLIRAQYEATRDNTAAYVVEKWKKLALSLFATIAVAAVVYSTTKKLIREGKLSRMKLERGVLDGLLQQVQEEYFVKAGMSKRIYDVKMRKYRERIHDLDEEIPVLEQQLL